MELKIVITLDDNVKDFIREILSAKTHTELFRIDDEKSDIEKLNLPIRVKHCLEKIGVSNLRELEFLSINEIITIPNLGRTSIRRLYTECKSIGVEIGSKVGGRPKAYGVAELRSIVFDNKTQN